jgi:hypothetical protein
MPYEGKSSTMRVSYLQDGARIEVTSTTASPAGAARGRTASLAAGRAGSSEFDGAPLAASDLAACSETGLRLLYEENGRRAATFWEWRHKVILLCSAAVTAILAIAAWMYERKLGGAIAVPFSLGSGVAAACRVFDRRNSEILDQCLETGKLHESRLSMGRAALGIYGRILATRRNARTYSATLRRGYLALAVLFALLAAGTVLAALLAPELVYPARAAN